MSRSHLGTAGIVFIALLAFPRASSAGLMDYIHEMSGPQMIGGIVLHCKIYFDGTPPCKILDDIWKGTRAVRNLETREFLNGDLRLAVETIIYTSTGTNSDGSNYLAGRVAMVAVDPMLEVGTFRYKDFKFYHGVGASLNRLFVNDVSDFGNKGLKIRPVAFTFPMPGRPDVELDVALNLRWYPDGFGSDQFGFGPRVNGDRPSEWLVGFSWGFAW